MEAPGSYHGKINSPHLLSTFKLPLLSFSREKAVFVLDHSYSEKKAWSFPDSWFRGNLETGRRPSEILPPDPHPVRYTSVSRSPVALSVPTLIHALALIQAAVITELSRFRKAAGPCIRYTDLQTQTQHISDTDLQVPHYDLQVVPSCADTEGNSALNLWFPSLPTSQIFFGALRRQSFSFFASQFGVFLWICLSSLPSWSKIQLVCPQQSPSSRFDDRENSHALIITEVLLSQQQSGCWRCFVSPP